VPSKELKRSLDLADQRRRRSKYGLLIFIAEPTYGTSCKEDSHPGDEGHIVDNRRRAFYGNTGRDQKPVTAYSVIVMNMHNKAHDIDTIRQAKANCFVHMGDEHRVKFDFRGLVVPFAKLDDYAIAVTPCYQFGNAVGGLITGNIKY